MPPLLSRPRPSWLTNVGRYWDMLYFAWVALLFGIVCVNPNQAEILSMDKGCKSTLMIRNVMTDLQLDEASAPTPLFNDNRGAVDWSAGCNISKWLRHFNIREIAVRNDVECGDIVISHLPGVHNIADIFTKEISCDKLFQSLAYQLISPRDIAAPSDIPQENSK